MTTIKDSPFEEKHNETFGRHLVAKMDLSEGELIFQEKPIIAYSQFSETFESGTQFICISCFQVTNKDTTVECKNCKWPFCSRSCSMDELHCQLECSVLTENEVVPSQKAMHYLFLVRILQLKEKDAAKWNALRNLSSSFGTEDAETIAGLNNAAAAAQEFLLKFYKIEVAVSLVNSLLKILKINAFSFAEESRNKFPMKKCSTALYATACLISHACSANLEWSRFPGECEGRCTIALYCREDIPAGTMVTVSYTEKHNFEGTLLRRTLLFRDFKFWCQCKRCLDPNELDTFFSAVRCRICDNGWQLPISQTIDVVFKCDNCHESMQAKEVMNVQDSFRKELDDITALPVGSPRQEHLDTLIINATTKHRLHPGHHLVINANENWLSAQNVDILLEKSRKSEDIYQKFVSRAEQNLNAVSLFGNLGKRVALESMIGSAVARYNFKSRDYLSVDKDISDLDEKTKILQKIVGHFRRSISVADPRALSDETKNTIAEMRIRYRTWRTCLSECLSQSMKEKCSY